MTTFVTGPVTVSVPATSANLGPGYDAFGLALTHRDLVSVEVLEAPGVEITVEGRGEGEVPHDERHLVYRSMRAALERMGAHVPGIRMHCVNVVPHARGLGSSSAAIVAGVSLARAVVAGGSLLMDDEALLDVAAELEGHPDNVAPALLGGFTIAFHDGTSYRASGAAVDPRVQAVVFVPPEGVETRVARSLLPAVVPHADAAANAARAALLVSALGRQPELLLAATEDRLHQAYREPAMPASIALLRRLREDGLPAVVSGAGPSVLVLTDASQQEAVASRVPQGWDVLCLGIDRDGARVALP
jgi:homoserine kinase